MGYIIIFVMLWIYLAVFLVGLVDASKKIQINESNSDWIEQHLNAFQLELAGVNQLVISRSHLNQTMLLKILSSSMPQLTILNLGNRYIDQQSPLTLLSSPHPQILTPLLLQSLFKSAYFPSLIQLHLIDTSIDDCHLHFLQGYSYGELKLQRLSLDNNLIGRIGFKRLSGLQMKRLKYLSLRNTLLIQEDVVEYVLEMVCSYSDQSIQLSKEKSCNSQLEYIDISSTNIQPESFLRILTAINPLSLQHLCINNINLHQHIQYATPFNLTTYQILAQMTFNNLHTLEMDWMNLDDQILQLFAKWKLPNLKKLTISRNFIGDVGIQQWISKENMPMLVDLNVYSNDITKIGLQYIIQQHPTLAFINIGKNKVSSSTFTSLTSLPLKHLNLKLSKIQPKDLQFILKNTTANLLEEISLSGNNQIQSLFELVNWNSLIHLQMLVLNECYLRSSLLYLLKNGDGVVSDSVQYIWLNQVGNDARMMGLLLNGVSRMFPAMKYISMIEQKAKGINFTQIKNITSTFTVELSYLTFITNRDKYQIIKLTSIELIIYHSSKYNIQHLLGKQYNNNLKLINNQQHLNASIITLAAQQLHSLFNISGVRQLVIGNMVQYDIWCAWMQLQGGGVWLQVLRLKCSLYPQEVVNLLRMMGNRYRQLQLHLKIRNGEQRGLIHLCQFLQSITTLQVLSLQFIYPNNTRNHIHNNHHIFNILHFPFLTSLTLTPQLELEELAGIVKRHASTLRQLMLPYNFIEEMSMQLFRHYNLILRRLTLSGISYSVEEFSYLGGCQLGYLYYLNVDRCQLTDFHLQQMIRRSKRSYVFGKLRGLNLNQNEVHGGGLISLLESQMYELNEIHIERLNNPNFLNIILTYRTNIAQIQSVDLELNPIIKTLHPTSTRAIETLFINSFYFQSADYAILSSLNFKRLHNIALNIHNIYECSALLKIFNATKHASYMIIYIENEENGLNSECFTGIDEFQNELQSLVIKDLKMTTNIPLFVRYVRTISLKDMRLSPKAFSQINTNLLKYLKALDLRNNYVDDDAFAPFAQSPQEYLSSLDISYTQITSASILKFTNRTFPRLELINLSGISLNEITPSLSTISMPYLLTLSINACDLTSLQFLHEMKLTNLVRLQLSYNSLTLKELSLFLSSFSREKMPKLKVIFCLGIPINKEEQKQIAIHEKGFQLSIFLQEPKYSKLINNAKY